MTLAALYDDLARWQWSRRSAQGLAMRKRLLANGISGDDLDAWMARLAGVRDGDRVLDLGCGFGATLVAWARAHDVTGVGITLSGFQGSCATSEIARLGLTDRLEVVTGTYDDPPAGPFDVIVGVESLCHAPDLGRTLRRAAGVAGPGARLLTVEDTAVDSDLGDDPDALELMSRWSTRRLWSLEDWKRGLAEAGWDVRETHDLTDRVPALKTPAGAWRRGGLLMMRALTPSARRRRVWDAFLGGFALERLYARGLMRYRVLLCDRGADS